MLAWLGVVGSQAARAQQAPVESNADSAQTEQARQLYKDGVKEAALEQWEKARELFAEAFRLKHHFQIAFNLGQAEFKVGRYVEAAEHLAFFLREGQDVAGADQRAARALLGEARNHVGTLHVDVNQAGAEIFVDGTSLGKALVCVFRAS